MNTNGYFLIGRIPKTLSFKGDVLIIFQKGLPVDIESQEFFFLKTPYGLVPFHVESFEMNNREGAIVRFTDAADEEKAKELVGMEVFLPDELLTGIPDEEYTAALLVGYKVNDKDTGKLGTVIGVMELPEQSLLEIRDGKKEFLIPLVREMIVKFDHRKKTILFDLPEGLVDLND